MELERAAHQLRSSLNPMPLKLLGGLHNRDDRSLAPHACGAESFSLQVKFLSLETCPILQLCRAHLELPHYGKSFYHPGNDERCRSSVSWTRDKDQTEKKTLITTVTQEIPRVLESLCQGPNIHILLCSRWLAHSGGAPWVEGLLREF